MKVRNSTDKLHVNILADLCAAYGLRKVVISPGSRNAPLIMAFHNHPDMECFVIPDERSAAYFAIGIAQFTQLPVGIICTSGTAALNYAPAMAEAYYQKLPLIAITADRPPEWIGQLDGQTVNQSGIYANFTSYQAQLPVDVFSKNEVWHLERIIRDGFLQLKNRSQPIHFNVPIREPLYNKTEQKYLSLKPTVFASMEPTLLDDENLMKELQKHTKILLILGMRLPDPVFSNLIHQVALGKNIVVLRETLSNVQGECSFQTSDALLVSVQDRSVVELKPDLVITFGDILLSKPLKQWIRSLDYTDHWMVSQTDVVPDVFQRIERIIHLAPDSFLQCLSKYSESGGKSYYDAWSKAYRQFAKQHSEYVDILSWSDMQVFKVLSETLHDNSCIHLGNSSPVRYAQFFSWKKDIQFFSNRGTAGIDGVASTAIGMASQTDQPVTLITGDVSFFYDSNAFWNNYKRKNFKVIVLNNKGGNIFSLISGPADTGSLNDYFVTHIPVSIEYLCKAYGIGYYLATDEQELNSGLGQLFANPGCALLEIETDPEINTRVWKEYFKAMKDGNGG